MKRGNSRYVGFWRMPPLTLFTLVTRSPVLRMTIVSLYGYLVIGALLINATQPASDDSRDPGSPRPA
jgi:hypothetical protein